MPRISEFYGLQVYLYYNDHEPAHFHVRYGEYHTRISIDPVRLIDGRMPRRALNMVLEWAEMQQLALKERWDSARARRPLDRIEPLD